MNASTATSRDGGLPPGSLGPPLLGETIAAVRNQQQFYIDHFRRYGPVFKTRLVGRNVVVFAGAEAVSFFLSHPAFDRRGANPPAVRELLAHDSLTLLDGPQQRARKRLTLTAYGQDALDAYIPLIERVSLRHIARWRELGSFAWLPEYQHLSAVLTSALFLADESDARARALHRLLDRMREGFFVLPINLRWNAYGHAVGSRDRVLAWIGEAIAQHRRTPADNMTSRITDAFRGHEFSDRQLQGDLLHLLLAMQGTTFAALTFLSLMLAQHPEVRERARQEVLAHAAEGPLTMERLGRLEYLERLSRELRRLAPITPATFFATVTEPVEFKGYRIPAGWRAVAALQATMRDPAVFPDPERFDPDRFLPERLAQMPENSYVPHGGGPRVGHRCPGEDFTTMLLMVSTVLLLRRYTWELLPQDLRLGGGLFPLPREGLRVRFSEYAPQREAISDGQPPRIGVT